MITERDIWATAKMLVDKYGDAAGFHAASRADELLDQGDVDGQRTWTRIVRAVEALLRLPSPGSAGDHPPTRH